MLSNCEIMNAISFHGDSCVFCNSVDKSVVLGQYLTQDFPVSSIAEKMGITQQVIVEHLNAMLALTSAGVMVQQSMLKIVARLESLPPDKIRAADSIAAAKVFLEVFKATQKRPDSSQNVSFENVSSSSLMGIK